MNVTTAPIVDVEIGDHTYKLMMGLRACNKIGLNPFKNAEAKAYLDDVDGDKIAAFIIAGVENASKVLKVNQAEPSREDIMDYLSFQQFLLIYQAAFAMPGGNGNGNGSEPLPNH